MSYFKPKKQSAASLGLAGPDANEKAEKHYEICAIWMTNDQMMDGNGGEKVKQLLKISTNLTGEALDRAALNVLCKAKDAKDLQSGVAKYGAISDGRPSSSTNQNVDAASLANASITPRLSEYYNSSSPIPPMWYGEIDKELVQHIEHQPQQAPCPSNQIQDVAAASYIEAMSQQQVMPLFTPLPIDTSKFQVPRKGSSAIKIVAPSDKGKAVEEQPQNKSRSVQAQSQDRTDSAQVVPASAGKGPVPPPVNQVSSQVAASVSTNTVADVRSPSKLYVPPHRWSANQGQSSMSTPTANVRSIPSANELDLNNNGGANSNRGRRRGRGRRRNTQVNDDDPPVIMPNPVHQPQEQQRRGDLGQRLQFGRHEG